MAFKIKKILTERQVFRAKWSIGLVVICLVVNLCASFAYGAKDPCVAGSEHLCYDNEAFSSTETEWYPRGRIVYYSHNDLVCNSSLLIPGTAILPNGLLAVFYALTLVYLFLGIYVVSDIFMASIERITSQTQIVKVQGQGQEVREQKVKVWNPTVANLTLMALGSSAPEILLAVIEAASNLGGCPGELGASTIVGSAAFNLLVITAACIYAVDDTNDATPDGERDPAGPPKGVKKIYDMGVFAVTAGSSIFAYAWLYWVLRDQKVDSTEAWLTFVFFFVLVGLAWACDRFKERQMQKLKGKEVENSPVIEYSAVEIYRELIDDKQGRNPTTEAGIEKRAKMKNFVKETMKTDQIDKVQLADLKTAIEGEGLIKRIQYRKQVGIQQKKQVVAKGEIYKAEHVSADALDETEKHPRFGFRCLHYSVSESSGTIIIHVINKQKTQGSVRVATIDKEAKAGEDYEKVDTILQFSSGQAEHYIEVTINDDDNWEPDEDFLVQLYEDTGSDGHLVELHGKDTLTRVTIIDDDKPGQIYFEATKNIKAIASERICEVKLLRKNGSDGIVTVNYKTKPLDNTEETATPDVDYVPCSGKVTFQHQEMSQTIEITILEREDLEERDESFGIQLSNIFPEGAKLSKNSYKVINIVTDVEGKKKEEALAQLLARIESEEQGTWTQQFITACMLHPTKGEDGEIEDIGGAEALLHFLCIGWKMFYSLIPPAHYGGGLPCFVISLAFIGFTTFIIGEFADLFGCVLLIKPSVTAITFVALGTSLPDTFASMLAATNESTADASVGNVTGSNSVNVFLGLGLPWVIATLWEENHTPEQKGYDSKGTYFVPSESLGFSVVVFIFCAFLCILLLVIRRFVVGGELGGSPAGRIASAAFLISLWLFYIIMCIIQAYGSREFQESVSMGIDFSVLNPNKNCLAQD